jgi:hypothetical protein
VNAVIAVRVEYGAYCVLVAEGKYKLAFKCHNASITEKITYQDSPQESLNYFTHLFKTFKINAKRSPQIIALKNNKKFQPVLERKVIEMKLAQL